MPAQVEIESENHSHRVEETVDQEEKEQDDGEPSKLPSFHGQAPPARGGPDSIGKALASVEEALMNVRETFGSKSTQEDSVPAEQETAETTITLKFSDKSSATNSPTRGSEESAILAPDEEVLHVRMPIPPKLSSSPEIQRTEVSFSINVDSPAILRKHPRSRSRDQRSCRTKEFVEETLAVGLKLRSPSKCNATQSLEASSNIDTNRKAQRLSTSSAKLTTERFVEKDPIEGGEKVSGSGVVRPDELCGSSATDRKIVDPTKLRSSTRSETTRKEEMEIENMHRTQNESNKWEFNPIITGFILLLTAIAYGLFC